MKDYKTKLELAVLFIDNYQEIWSIITLSRIYVLHYILSYCPQLNVPHTRDQEEHNAAAYQH